HHADGLLPLDTEQGLGNVRMTALVNPGSCLTALGRPDEGIPLLAAGVAGRRNLGYILEAAALTLFDIPVAWPGGWQAAPGHLAAARPRRATTSDCAQPGARLWELRAATSLAQLWRDQGKPAEAHALLAPVCVGSPRAFDTADQKKRRGYSTS